MATKIRLRRMGAKKVPFYRIVVADSRYPRDGRFIEEIGYYDPTRHPTAVKIDAERAKYWIGTGAQPSDTVKALMVKAGIMDKQVAKQKAQPEAQPAAGVTVTQTEEAAGEVAETVAAAAEAAEAVEETVEAADAVADKAAEEAPAEEESEATE